LPRNGLPLGQLGKLGERVGERGGGRGAHVELVIGGGFDETPGGGDGVTQPMDCLDSHESG
jgi:hypothetical protein